MKVFRIEHKKYLSDTLSGKGAALNTGFRWNSLHTRMVYTAENMSLAMLKIAVHLDLAQDLPTDRYFVHIEIPDELDILEIKPESLPPGWNTKPPIRITQLLGDEFVILHQAAVLKVPSSIIPLENNYLINPLHPDAKRIRVVSAAPLVFDPRLQKQKPFSQ